MVLKNRYRYRTSPSVTVQNTNYLFVKVKEIYGKYSRKWAKNYNSTLEKKQNQIKISKKIK